MKQEPKNTNTRSRKSSRKAVDSKISLRMAMIFFAFMLLISLFLLIIPRSTFSEVERRSLATWPEFNLDNYFSGAFTSGITQVYDDTVPARDSFKNASNNLKSMFGIRSSGTAEIIGNAVRVQDQIRSHEEETTAAPVIPEATNTAAEPETTAVEETTPAEEINSKDYKVENYDAIMQDGIVVVFQDGHWRGIPLFGGLYDTMFADTVNYIHSAISDDVNVYVMPVPTSSQFYLPSNYSDYNADQEESYQAIAGRLDPGITSIDIIEAMNNHNEEPIYLRTDHHWTALGGYYAAREFARTADVPFKDLSTYTEYVNYGYVGTMYAYTSSAAILNDPEDFVYYVPDNAYTVDYYDSAFNYMYTNGLFFDQSAYVSNSYSTFLGTDDCIAKITTDVKNGRSLLMVKDSFGNAEVPFLTGSFETIYVIDQRYFDLNLLSFIAYTGVTDVLFTHSYFAVQGVDAELLQNITYYNGEVGFYDGAPAPVLPESTAADTSADAAADTAAEDTGDTAEDTVQY